MFNKSSFNNNDLFHLKRRVSKFRETASDDVRLRIAHGRYGLLKH